MLCDDRGVPSAPELRRRRTRGHRDEQAPQGCFEGRPRCREGSWVRVQVWVIGRARLKSEWASRDTRGIKQGRHGVAKFSVSSSMDYERSILSLVAFSAGASASVVTVAGCLRFSPQGFQLVPGLEILMVKDLGKALAFLA